MEIETEEIDRRAILKKFLGVDGVVSSEKRWWAGTHGFDFKTSTEGKRDEEINSEECSVSKEVYRLICG